MKIIAHRGGADLALENSATAFRKAVALGVDAIELDVRLTKDKRLVVNHDATLSRTSKDPRKVINCTWTELKDVKLRDGSPLLLLEDALKIIGRTKVYVELKDADSAQVALKVLARFPKANAVVISFKIQELLAVKQLRPEQACYAIVFARPLHIIRLAKKYQLEGLSIPLWITPLVAVLARGLEGYVWTINAPLRAKIAHVFLPHYEICTNDPTRFIVKS